MVKQSEDDRQARLQAVLIGAIDCRRWRLQHTIPGPAGLVSRRLHTSGCGVMMHRWGCADVLICSYTVQDPLLESQPTQLWYLQRDPDCAETMLSAGLLNRAASGFGAGPEFVRLELLMRQEEFELMADKLQKLALE